MRCWIARLLQAGCVILFAIPPYSAADDAVIAVATNFGDVAATLRDDFSRRNDHSIKLGRGSSGKLYAQIVHGAPYDALLSADQERPQRLELNGMAIANSRYTYALGRLAIWSRHADLIDETSAQQLTTYLDKKVAIANPKLAPYGIASVQSLEALGLWDYVSKRLVLGDSVGQAYAFTSTQNAQIGVVAMSYLVGPDRLPSGSIWIIPDDLHSPIRQDAVLLEHGKENAAAMAFLHYLQSAAARAIIRTYGYDTP